MHDLDRILDPAAWSTLAEDGWVVVPAFDLAAVERARGAYAHLGPAADDGGLVRSDSRTSRDLGHRRRSERVAQQILGDVLPMGNTAEARFHVLWPGERGGLGLHQVGEAAEGKPGIEVEIALDGNDGWSGLTWVVAGSHRWFSSERETLPEAAAAWLGATVAQRVDVGPGEALVCDSRLLRMVLPGDGLPQRAVAARWPWPDDPPSGGPSDAASLTTDDARHAWARGGREPAPERPAFAPACAPDWCSRCGRPIVDPRAPSAGDEPRWARRPSRWCEPCEGKPVAAMPERGSVRTWPSTQPPLESLPEAPTPVLRSARLDARLRRDGFVVVPDPVIAPDRAAELRSEFGALHSWRGMGHLNDFNHRAKAYRNAATDLMIGALGPAVDAVFTDHEPFLSTFLCKWPGVESELEPHQDWTYVDETSGERTFAAFVALQPIEGHNGQVRVLRGSHRLDPMVRGTGLRPGWFGHREVIERHLESLPMAAGQLAVWNSALVHASYPNLTEEPRVAATLWMARRGVPLVHHRRIDRDRAARFAIDSSFYEEQNPYRLLVAEPPYEVEAVVPLLERYGSEAAFERRLLELRAPERGRTRRLLGRFARR